MRQKSFSLQVGAFRAKTEKARDQLIRVIVLDLFTSVIMMTPVKEGRARGNWVCGAGSKPSATPDVNKFDKSGQITVAAMTSKILGASAAAAKELWLLNSVAYILPLEYGHSGQAPHGMVRVSIVNAQNAVKVLA